VLIQKYEGEAIRPYQNANKLDNWILKRICMVPAATYEDETNLPEDDSSFTEGQVVITGHDQLSV